LRSGDRRLLDPLEPQAIAESLRVLWFLEPSRRRIKADRPNPGRIGLDRFEELAGNRAMTDPRPVNDIDATRYGVEDTQVDATEVEEPESTVFDPYATALPTPSIPPNASLDAEPVQAVGDLDGTTINDLESTEFDPYATRVDSGTGSIESTGLPGTMAWDDAGAAPGISTGHRPSRFHPVRLHARGGLGEVYVAVDGELNREVALKEIQEKHGGQAESQLRFVFEAEITGGLEHPGIVPVYGLGRHADGRPYYAMRFIRGDTFKAAIEKFQKSPEVKNSVSLRHSLALHQLLARFVAVCYAIDYAHSRGVLHRDIKPENVMLGGHGETLVVDWGLAKALNRPDPPDDSQPKPLRPLSGSDTSATMVGSVMGTPSFMSPEQAAGEVEKLGPASDIFSLGSMLYALLVGKAPFRDMPIVELLEKVKKAEFPAPRASNKAIPPSLEAICLKAMALKTSDRYATASALAADVERWIADEPVEAFPEPWNIRLGRWARMHRMAVAASFALLLTASTALGISTLLIGREKARTERNYQIARSAVEQMLTRVGEVELADVPQLEAVRRDLLDRALGFYREFLAERGVDSFARLETGRAMARLGDIRELLGQYVQAEKNYREALEILDRPTNDPENRRTLARTRVNLGILLKKSTRFTESEKFLRDGLRDRQGLAIEFPDNAEDVRGVSQARYQLGTLLAKLKDRSKEDEALYIEAIAEQEAIVARPAATVEDRRELARFLNNLGILQSGSRRDAAGITLMKAQTIQDAIEAQSSTSAGFRWQRARTWNNLAILYASARQLDESYAYFTKARQAFETLEADFPKIPDYRRERAITLNNLAQILQVKPSDQAKPLDLFTQALEDQRYLLRDFPEVPDHKQKLALTLLHLGDLVSRTDPARAEASWLEAIRLQEGLTTEFPEVPEFQATLGRTLTERAGQLVRQNKPEAAVDLLVKAIAALEIAWAGNPRESTYATFLMAANKDRGAYLVKLGRHDDLAVQAERLAKLTPTRPDFSLSAAMLFARASELAGSDAALKETYAARAIKALRDAINRGANDAAQLDTPGFNPLKGRPDFEALRKEWQAKGQKVSV
jgi:tetratricopeptide (TPR) repeat protein